MSETMRRAAIVTGAGRGIGRAIAQRLHLAEIPVEVADIDGASANRVAANLGSRALAVQVDVTDDVAVQNLVAAAVDQFGGVEILVNNAAFTGSTTGTPFGRAGRPEDVAEAVHFLVSENGGFIDGEILMVDGGAGVRCPNSPRLERDTG